MLVTVIVPVSETHRALVRDALNSVAGQTVRVAQVIVVNDSERPLEIGKWPFRIGVLNTGGGRWSSTARNMALAKVDTPFVFFLDADDGLTNIALETCLRAYGMWDVSYVYGDAIVQRNGNSSIVPGFEYDRELIANRNIHTVSALVPTRLARAVGGFDESLHGWEDWEFYIRLSEAGYCGKRVPWPLITYRLDTGRNRMNSTEIRPLIQYIRNRHQQFVNGRYEMGCCGSDTQLKQEAQKMFSPNSVLPDGKVLLEYVGNKPAAVTFNVNGNSYRAAANAAEKYITVDANDVEKLLNIGLFKPAPAPTSPAVPNQFESLAETPPFEPEADQQIVRPTEAPKVTRVRRTPKADVSIS